MNVAASPYRMLELCAGTGMLGLGVEMALSSARTICHVEREASAAAILASRMAAKELAPAPIWADVSTFDARRWRGAVDCVLSGDPCQPNSVAGKRAGASDDRFLIDQVVRIFDESGARRLFRENVCGNADGQLEALIPALERLGCRVAAGIFSAAEVGASHRRERLFIMADREGGGCGERRDAPFAGRRRHADGSDETLAHSNSGGCGGLGQSQSRGIGGQSGNFADRSGGSGASLADAERDGFERGGKPSDIRQKESEAQGAGDQRQRYGRHALDSGPAPRTADAGGAGSQGREFGGACDDERHRADAHGSAAEFCGTLLFAPGPSDPRWIDIIAGAPHLEPAICRMADGLANRLDRLRACGNGVVPLAAAYAWASLDALLLEGRRSAQALVRAA